MSAWPLLPTRRGMLLVQLGVPAAFAVHYALEGAATAAFLNALGAAQLVSSLLWGRAPHLKWIGHALVPAILAGSVVTWDGLPSLLSTLLIAVGRIQLDRSRLRTLVLAGAPFWLVHDALVASPVVIADTISIVLGLLAIVRENGGGLRQVEPRRPRAGGAPQFAGGAAG